MFGVRVEGLLYMIPSVTLFLMYSFFVLVVTKKLDSRGFKVFGYVVAALLWVSIVLTVEGNIMAMMRRAQQMKPSQKFPMASSAMQGRPSAAQFPRQMMVPQAAQQPNATVPQNK